MVVVDRVEITLDVELEGGAASSLGMGDGDVVDEGKTSMDGV